MLRTITAQELDQVAGGQMLPWDVEVTPSDPTQAPNWLNLLEMLQNPCGPLAEEYITCGIIVNAQWRTLDMDEGQEIRTYSDGSQALFVNGEFSSMVRNVKMSVTNGTPSGSYSMSHQGFGITYHSGNSNTVTFDYIPGN